MKLTRASIVFSWSNDDAFPWTWGVWETKRREPLLELTQSERLWVCHVLGTRRQRGPRAGATIHGSAVASQFPGSAGVTRVRVMLRPKGGLVRSIPGPTSVASRPRGGERTMDGCPPECKGSTAKALVNLGVFASVATAVDALDAQIVEAHQKLDQNGKRKRGLSETEAGIRGVWWHLKAVSLAVHHAGWHFKKVFTQRGHAKRVDLREELMRGAYLVIGVREPDDLEKWAYTVGVSGGRVKRVNRSDLEPIANLCLDENNRPDPRRSTFMCDIKDVYRLDKCSNPEAQKRGECRGECVMNPSVHTNQNTHLRTTSAQSTGGSVGSGGGRLNAGGNTHSGLETAVSGCSGLGDSTDEDEDGR